MLILGTCGGQGDVKGSYRLHFSQCWCCNLLEKLYDEGGVTHCSCESEYVGLNESRNEAIYLTQLQGELGVGNSSVLLYGDNESSLKLAENPLFHQRSKHILLR